MASTPDEAVAALASLLHADPPASLTTLDPALVRGLTDAVAAESRRQSASISRSVDDALRLVPRPFRGIVKKMIVP